MPRRLATVAASALALLGSVPAHAVLEVCSATLSADPIAGTEALMRLPNLRWLWLDPGADPGIAPWAPDTEASTTPRIERTPGR